jgi:hypothetical protein
MKRIFRRSLALLVLLSAGDLAGSILIFSLIPHAFEVNPVAAFVLARAGYRGLCLFKLAWLLVASFVLWLIFLVRPRLAVGLNRFGLVLYASVVIYEAIYLLTYLAELAWLRIAYG